MSAPHSPSRVPCVAALALAIALAAASSAQPLDPVAWYSFQGDLTDSAGSYDGVPVGPVTYVTGVCTGSAQALHLEGATAVRFGPIGNFGINDFSIAMWIRVAPGAPDLIEVLSKRSQCGLSSYVDLRLSLGRPSLEIFGSTNDSTPSGVLIPIDIRDGLWHLVTFTRDAPIVRGYLDGVHARTTVAAADMISNSADLTLAGGPCVDGKTTVALTGDVDELQIYHRALTPTEVAGMFAGVTSCPSDFDRNCLVNSTDVSAFINAWFEDQANGTIITDWDINGIINSTDVSQFINDWFTDMATGCGA